MSRFHRIARLVDGRSVVEDIPFTPEEEVARDAEEAAWAAGQPARDAEEARLAGLKNDPQRADLIDRLRTATAQQISDYIDANVTDLASARVLLKKIVLVLSLIVRS